MNASKGKWSGFRSAFFRRSGIVALSGLMVALLTPFVIFPEIMGDRGVTASGPLRNWTAVALLIGGVSAAIFGAMAYLGERSRKRFHG